MRIPTPGRLRSEGIMGINQRNAHFIMPYNQRSKYPLVDDKLLTKQLAARHDIAVPELYAVIEIEHDVRELFLRLADRHCFVIKPAQGSGGNGVLVITDKIGNTYERSNGNLITPEAIQRHASNILSGMYSLGGIPDKAIIEYLIHFDPIFKNISYQGVPDIRVIVFRGIPIIAMLRLPTRSSDGKANLHQGAVGVGIDLQTGITHLGVRGNRPTPLHPDTGARIEGVEIPHWEKLLILAARCADMVGLGYIGVDLVLDRDLGPLMLELNARPGLNVQLANGFGLLHRLHAVEKIERIPPTAEERVTLARREFCSDRQTATPSGL